MKFHKYYSDQVALLKSRGLIISDDEHAATVNYYRLSGYLHEFKKEDGSCYAKCLTFDKALALYHFGARTSVFSDSSFTFHFGTVLSTLCK